MGLNAIIPKKFLWRYELSLGCFIVGIFMMFIMIICGVVIIAQVVSFKYREQGYYYFYVWRNAYSLSITTFIYCIFMVAVNIWFILSGVKKQKSSVVLSWVVITTMWLAQTFCLLIVLLVMYLNQVNFVAWILSLVFGLIGICIPFYGLLVGYGFWLELKNKARTTNTNPSNP